MKTTNLQKKTTSIGLLALIVLLISSCFSVAERNTGSDPVSHDAWHTLLQKHVHEDGLVDYQGFIQDSTQLNQYLATLSGSYPDPNKWSREERLAYWINAYNAFTIQIVIRNYPVESIRDIGPMISVPFINSVWDLEFITIEGKEMSLNHIEHGILRAKFDEPRIHFAINCASASCPDLINEAYTPEKLEVQLQERAVGFINNPIKNKIQQDQVEVSKIFDWFGGDFTKKSDLIGYLNQYSKTKIKPGADVGHLDYDWALNDFKTP